MALVPFLLFALVAGIPANAASATPQERPAPRFAHAMAYDAARDRVVLFGGTTGTIGKAPLFGDTWEWDGAGWARVDVHGPAPRAYAAMGFDPSRRVVVLHGGRRADDTTFADTWEYDGRSWTQAVDKGPTARDHHALVYDPERRVLLSFGGWDGGSRQTYNDLWAWDGRTWRLISDGGPPARSAYGLAWDDHRKTLLMYAGTNVSARHADLWEWSGRAWQSLTDPYANPNRNHFALWYQPSARRFVAFGGLDRRHNASATTLLMYGNRFEAWQGDAPPARFNHAVVRLREDQALLFGGCARPTERYISFGDTWLWDGTAWRHLDGVSSPPE